MSTATRPDRLDYRWNDGHRDDPGGGLRNQRQLNDQLGALEVHFTSEDLARLDAVTPPGRAVVPYYLDDDFADWQPERFRW
jgi:hypothetical protein